MASATTLEDRSLSLGEAGPRLVLDSTERSFKAPRPRPDFVRRDELLSRLESTPPLILLTAPAGYGKSSLLTQWARESGRPTAWVTLREDDGDPDVLAEVIAGAEARLASGPRRRTGGVLVLDDAHRLPPDVVGDAVLAVLDRLPEGSRLAVASRCAPELPLGRLRVQQTLVELHARDLSMSAVEAAWLLQRAGVALDFGAIQTLVGRMEGWPAALGLAAVAGAERPGPAESGQTPRGDDHLVSDYLRTELLSPLSPGMVRFLTRSSVLERLSGPLCDEVLGRRRSATMLAELTRAGVPIEPLDPSHEWYRLHGLLREMLQTELRRSDPELAVTLHRRAADWHHRAGDVERAIDHARSGEDLERVGELLWPHVPEYLSQGRNHLVQGWLSDVTGERAAGHPRVTLSAAHSSLALGQLATAEQWARSTSVSLAQRSERTTKLERAGVLIIQAWAARLGARRMAEDATRAYELLPDDSPWRASCCFLNGTAALLTGNEDDAERSLLEGAARAVPAWDSAALCLSQLAVLATGRDDPYLAADFARRARSIVEEHGLADYPTSALVFAVGAATDMWAGQVDRAKAAVAHCLCLLDRLDDSLSWYGAETRILLARVALALGDVAGARELLAHASRLGRRTPDVVVFQKWFDDAWEQFDARAELALTGIATLTTAELRVLRFLPTHYSFQEIAQRLKVSSNTVKTHVHAVYRKLEASSRSEAVASATAAGLLGG